MQTVEVIRTINLVMRFLIIGLCAAAWVRRPERRLWVIPPVSWAAHGVIYYIVLMSGIALSPAIVSLWTAALGLHVGFLIVGCVWLFIWPARRWSR